MRRARCIKAVLGKNRHQTRGENAVVASASKYSLVVSWISPSSRKLSQPPRAAPTSRASKLSPQHRGHSCGLDASLHASCGGICRRYRRNGSWASPHNRTSHCSVSVIWPAISRVIDVFDIHIVLGGILQKLIADRAGRSRRPHRRKRARKTNAAGKRWISRRYRSSQRRQRVEQRRFPRA